MINWEGPGGSLLSLKLSDTFRGINRAELQLSGCDNPSPVGLTGVRIDLLEADLNTLKLNRFMGINPANTRLVILTGNGVLDAATRRELQAVNVANARRANNVIRDITDPRVREDGFLLFDLDAGQFTIGFDEPIDASSITVPGSLRFQHHADVTLAVDSFTVQALSCIPPGCADGTRITFTFPRAELNRLKLSPRICTSAATCWLTIEAVGAFVTDMAGNAIVPLPNGLRISSRYLGTFIDDSSGPILESYTLNMTSRELLLNFDEPVEPGSVDVSGITMQSAPGVADPDLFYQLTSARSISVDENIVSVLVSDADIDALQSRPAVAAARTNTYLSLERRTAVDLSYLRNMAQAISNNRAQLAAAYVPDLSPPEIDTFSLDLDANTLTLEFTEPVLVSTFAPQQLVVNSASSRTQGVSYRLTGGDVHPTSLAASAEITFTLTDEDVTFLEVNASIATGAGDTYLSALAGLADDTNGLTSTDLSPIPVSSFTSDVSSPSVVAFQLDMDSGEIVVTFDDAVVGSTFDVSAITLQNQPFRQPMQWHTLSRDSSFSSVEDGFVVTVTVGTDDLNRVKQIRSLCTNETNCYLTATATIADDPSGADTIAVTDGKSLQVSGFTRDRSRPSVDSWVLDMNVGQVILIFTETVDITTFQAGQLSLQNRMASSSVMHTLTGYRELIPPDADSTLAIQLSEIDANVIKANTNLGTAVSNSYLSITADTIMDMNSNAVFGIGRSQAQQASRFVSDDTNPILRSFSLNMNSGALTLTFDETVNTATFNVSALTLVNRAFRSFVRHTLIDSTFSNVNSAVVEVILSENDFNAVKAIADLASSASDTYIIATSYTVRDMNGNPLTAIADDSALQVLPSGYVRDAGFPRLDSFELNLSTEQLLLTFTESVRATSLDPTQITLQSTVSSTIAGTRTLTLTGGTHPLENGRIITLQLSEDDANTIKRFRDIATSRFDTYLSLTSSAVEDTAGNSVMAVSDNNAEQATALTRDDVQPELLSFSLDLDQRLLALTYDETVDVSTFSITRVILQDRQTRPTQSVTLGALSTIQSPDGTVVVIGLSDDDFNLITSTFPLATMDTNTFISLEAGTVQDTSGNPSVEILPSDAMQITNHTVDDTRPSLENFDLDLDNGVITLVFSESVNITSFDHTQLTLQNERSSPSSTHTLGGGIPTQRLSTTIDVSLLPNDLNRLKALPDLASQRSNTYLSITSGTVKDMNDNLVNSRSMSDALLVNEYTRDETEPGITGFDLDYNSGVLTVYFDETVDLGTLDSRALTFQNTMDGSDTNTHTLQSSMGLDTGLLTFTRVRLSDDDLNELKRLRICVAGMDCYMHSTSFLVQDVPGNSNAVIDRTSALLLGSYMADETLPQVASFIQFDVDAGLFTLEFSETVDISSLNFSEVSLENAYANSTHVFMFEELSPTDGDNVNITFALSEDDLNRLKLNTDLCTYEGNCWIRFSREFISDVVGNPIVPIIADTIDTFHQPALFTPDEAAPILLSYTIDLDSGRMTFLFNEVVRLATFTPMNLTFQDADVRNDSVNLREPGSFERSNDGLMIDWNMTKADLNLLKAYEDVFSSMESSYLTYSYLVEDVSGNRISPRTDGVNALQVSTFTEDTTRPQLESFKAFSFDNWTFTLQFDEPVNLSSINLEEIAITRNHSFDIHIYDPIRINDWYSLYFENGSIYNLTHLFAPGEYILTCPFSLEPTTAPPTEMATTTSPPPTESSNLSNYSGSGSGSGFGIFSGLSGSGSGSGLGEGSDFMDQNLTVMMEEMLGTVTIDDPYPILLRGCTIYRNLTVVEPFFFLTGGDLSYVDERKQQVMVMFNRFDLRMLKLSLDVATNDTNTWIAYNSTALRDMSSNEVIPTSLFNATKLDNGGFVNDVTPPVLEFITLDMDSSVLSLHFSDVMDVQSVVPLLIDIFEYPDSNNSYALRGPYPRRQPLMIDQRDNYTIDIPLSFDDMNNLKNNLDLATSEFNTYVTFPSGIATDIYGQRPPGVPPTRVQTLIPDTTGPILVSFDLDLNIGVLNLTFDEVVNPNTVMFEGITIQNMPNSSRMDFPHAFDSHTFVEGGEPLINDTGVVTLQLQLDLDLNALKIAPDIANSVNDTFIRIDLGTVLDMKDNPSQTVVDGKAIQISNIVEDTSQPFLRYFDLDLNDNFLILKFSEAVFPDTLNLSAISLLSSPSSPRPVVIDPNSRVIRREFDSLLYVQLTVNNEDELKDTRRPIAKSPETTYLSIDSFAAEDYFGFNVLNISDENAVRVRLYFEGQFYNII